MQQNALKGKLAGFKCYINIMLPDIASAGFVIGAYHQLRHIEKSFRMSKSHLAALAIVRRIETATGVP